jgi:hypothetical protein
MKFTRKVLSLLVAMALLMVAVVPAFAQLGDTDVSSFTVQNISGGLATVTIQFVSETGAVTQPVSLGSGITNPFTLADGASKNIYVPSVPGLSSGRYSVIISSTAKVIAIASVSGTGTRRFTGNYTGFSTGASPFYLATFAYDFYGWYSLISVQNLGGGPANVTVTLKCNGSPTTGTLSKTNLASMASVTWALKNTTPTGFTAGVTKCGGSAVITSTQPVVATDSQSKPLAGNTNTFSGVASGSPTLYIPTLTNNYYGWSHSLSIQKLDAGSTTVTIDYSDTVTNSTCNLTDAQPSCQLYIPSVHPATGQFGAILTTSPSKNIVAVVTSSKSTLSSAYNGVGEGSNTVKLPGVNKAYYNWNSSFTCQNVGSTATTINISYEGYPGNAYSPSTVLNKGDTLPIYVPGEAFLPSGYAGGVTVKANAVGAVISCIVDSTNASWTNPATPGDWTQGYNGFGQ